MKDWTKMSGVEKVDHTLKFYSTQGENRYAIFYEGKIVWLGNKSTFKTEGIARRQLNEKLRYVTPHYKEYLDKLFEEGALKIKQV